MLQGEVIQDEVQYWICIPSTVQTGIQSHICDFFFFFFAFPDIMMQQI